MYVDPPMSLLAREQKTDLQWVSSRSHISSWTQLWTHSECKVAWLARAQEDLLSWTNWSENLGICQCLLVSNNVSNMSPGAKYSVTIGSNLTMWRTMTGRKHTTIVTELFSGKQNSGWFLFPSAYLFTFSPEPFKKKKQQNWKKAAHHLWNVPWTCLYSLL